MIYYQLSVKGYVSKIKKAVECGELENAAIMKKTAMKKQPKRMKRLLKDVAIEKIDS